jgi:hypothetical protein
MHPLRNSEHQWTRLKQLRKYQCVVNTRRKRTIISVLEDDSNAASCACQDVTDARVQEGQAVFPVGFSPVNYDDRRARTRLVVARVDPKALWECSIGGVVKVVERLRECLHVELGHRSGSELKLGHTSPHPCRVLLLLLGSAGRAGSAVQLPEVDPLGTMAMEETWRVKVERTAAACSGEHDDEG